MKSSQGVHPALANSWRQVRCVERLEARTLSFVVNNFSRLPPATCLILTGKVVTTTLHVVDFAPYRRPRSCQLQLEVRLRRIAKDRRFRVWQGRREEFSEIYPPENLGPRPCLKRILCFPCSPIRIALVQHPWRIRLSREASSFQEILWKTGCPVMLKLRLRWRRLMAPAESMALGIRQRTAMS